MQSPEAELSVQRLVRRTMGLGGLSGREAKHNFEVDTGAMTEMLSDIILIRCEGSHQIVLRSDMT